MLVDTNPHNVATARMNGLKVHYASIGSEFVMHGVDLGDIGRILAMTPNDEVTSIASMEFREVFGSANVYQLAPPAKSRERHGAFLNTFIGRVLFGYRSTFDELQERLDQGLSLRRLS